MGRACSLTAMPIIVPVIHVSRVDFQAVCGAVAVKGDKKAPDMKGKYVRGFFGLFLFVLALLHKPTSHADDATRQNFRLPVDAWVVCVIQHRNGKI